MSDHVARRDLVGLDPATGKPAHQERADNLDVVVARPRAQAARAAQVLIERCKRSFHRLIVR